MNRRDFAKNVIASSFALGAGLLSERSYGKTIAESPCVEPREEIVQDAPEVIVMPPMSEYTKCKNDFAYFCKTYVKIYHPCKGLIPFELRQEQIDVVDAYETNRFNILKKYRQGGFSTVNAVWAAWKVFFKSDYKVMICTKTDREAICTMGIVKMLIEHMPEEIKETIVKQNDHMLSLTNGSILWCGAIEATCGRSLNALIVDEAAFIKSMNQHFNALFPTLKRGGQFIAVSTPYGLNNWFADTYRDALAGKNKFNVIETCYLNHPDYSNPKWAKEVRHNMGEHGWRQEVLAEFI